MNDIPLLTFVTVLSIAACSIHAQEPLQRDVFGEALNACLATPDNSPVECARIASSLTDREIIEITRNTDFTSGTPQGTRHHIWQCDNPDLSAPKVCVEYNCHYDNNNYMSICDITAYCEGEFDGIHNKWEFDCRDVP